MFGFRTQSFQRMNAKRVIIVGGVAGGASAAARARRLSEDSEIIVFERGPHVSFANCGLPYYVGEEIREEKQLLDRRERPEKLTVVCATLAG